jgi:hypothetical protein
VALNLDYPDGAARFTWGEDALIDEGGVRARYIAALRAADARDYAPLLAFVRSGNAGL